MPLEQTTRLPFFDDFPVHVQIRIQSAGRQYEVFIQAYLGSWYRYRIGLQQHDVEELNSGLQQAMEQVSARFDVDMDGNITHEDKAECAKALSTLAQKGNFAFKRIFEEGMPRETVNNVLQPGATIQVTSEDFFIPWELLYDGPLGNQADISYFWGMRYIISRALIHQQNRPGDYVYPTIKSCRPRIGLIAYDQLSHVVNQEIPTLKRLRRQQRIYLSFLRPLDASQRDKELDQLGGFLGKKLQVTHLACEAYVRKPSSQSCLLVSDDFEITIEDFRVREFDLKHNPLVILNACLTGTMNPLYTSNWAAVFRERGARGVLATESCVPDWFAAAFAQEFYKHFLSGEPVGKALLATRLHFCTEQSNPLGLGYALYSSPSIRIEPSTTPPAKEPAGTELP